MVRFLDAPLNHSLVRALRRVPDFAPLDDKVLLRIVGASTNLFWPKGEVVFEMGHPSEGLYVVLSGEVRIFDGEGAEVARIGSGEYFGELSLLSRATHSKTAEATADCELMVVPADSFGGLLDADEELAEQIRKTMRLRKESVRLS